MDSEFLQARIDKTKLLIAVYEDAAEAIGTGGAQSYTLDTGQSRQTVTKLDLAMLSDTLAGLYNRCAMLEARLNGGNTHMARPAW